MLYHPKGLYVWDTWYFEFEGALHCIHLQIPRPDSDRPSEENGAIGHAVSTDLMHWTTLSPALYRGAPGAIDDGELWTGCVFQKDGTQYLYYTARSVAEGCYINRIALACATDGAHFERWHENPIITPDERWYCSREKPLGVRMHGWPIVDCRDLCVVADPEGNGYYGFFAARRPAQTTAESSVIAIAHSDDLIHWEQLPPCFTPEHFGCVEVPEVFYLNGKWYMLCLTGNRYGHRGRVSDPLLREATIYAAADRVQGPYRMLPEDNVVFGSIFAQGYCGKTVLWRGERILFFTQGEMKAGCPHGCISLPQRLTTDGAGRLRATWYAPLAEQYAALPAPRSLPVSDGSWGSIGAWCEDAGHFIGACLGDWALLPFEQKFADGMLCCKLSLRNAVAAGLAFRMGDQVMDGGLCLLLDGRQGEVELTAFREFPLIEKRTFPVNRAVEYSLRIVLEGNVVYVYLEDCLLIQCFEPGARLGRVGLMVEDGEATFTNLTLYEKKR